MVMRPSDGKSRVNEAGDFIYIKPDVPHEVFNMSDTEPVVAFVARPSAPQASLFGAGCSCFLILRS
jgi:uncharacterized RmlC-like cupin family protein